jgi:hypothetical protein
VYALPLARQKRKQELEEKQAREEHGLEQLEKIAAFIEDAMTRFLPETPGKPIVDLTLSSPEAPSKLSAHRRQRQAHRRFRRTIPSLTPEEKDHEYFFRIPLEVTASRRFTRQTGHSPHVARRDGDNRRR